MCTDSDVQDKRKCFEAYPTDTLLWCGECTAEVEAANGGDNSGETEQ